MQIRTITAGAREADLERAANAAIWTRQRLERAGYVVQTLRLALSMSGSNTCADFATVAQGAEQFALEAGFDYVSLGQIEGNRIASVAEALAATEAVFASVNIAGPDGAIRHDAIAAAAEAIVQLGATTPQGFGNLRFAASACVPPGSPFFPAAYHDGSEPWIAVGPEAAALAVAATTSDNEPQTTDRRTVITTSIPRMEDESVVGPFASRKGRLRSSVIESLSHLTQLIEQHDRHIADALADLEPVNDVRYAGCDWSFAPYPDDQRSIGAAIESLSGVPFGAWGTLAAVRGLTAAVRAARVRQLGFSGVMLPVLEDVVLAQRNRDGYYTLRDLLAFSAVCGTGLDTIPLAGDATSEQVAGILLEVAALASSLRKPLTARLLPIPGLSVGRMTSFDFPYFVNTLTMRLA